jgi:hypothetical protein
MRLIPIVLLLCALPFPSLAALIFYDQESTFLAENTLLVLEDFEAAASYGATTGPLNALTDSDIYSPGELALGLEVSADPAGDIDLFVGEPGVNGRLDTAVGFNHVDGSLVLRFDGGVEAAGLSLYGDMGSADVVVELFGAEGLLTQLAMSPETVLDPTFLGVVSDDDVLITEIALSRDGLGHVNVYDVSFGASGVPEPGAALLLGLGLAGLAAGGRHPAPR